MFIPARLSYRASGSRRAWSPNAGDEKVFTGFCVLVMPTEIETSVAWILDLPHMDFAS